MAPSRREGPRKVRGLSLFPLTTLKRAGIITSRMKYQLFHNVDARFSRPGTNDDRFVRGYEGEIVAEDKPLLVVLEDIFMRHNRDDRPDGKTRPSLSVGDAIVLEKVGGTWTVDIIGFTPMGGVYHILEDYPR